ncbi:hypothetical protein Tco_1487243 [Tanacetum coccineum]
MPLITVPVVMKPMQSMSSSVTPVRLYGNLASGYESYMLAVHNELPNSTQQNVAKPLGKRRPSDPIAVQSHSETVYPRPIWEAVELSPTSYLDVGAFGHNLLRGGNSASGMSSLRSTGGGMNSESGSGGSGDDGNGNDLGTDGGKYGDDGGGGSGGEGI